MVMVLAIQSSRLQKNVHLSDAVFNDYYTHDNADNISAVSTRDVSGNGQLDYQYDEVNRLIDWQQYAVNGQTTTRLKGAYYRYDAVGNRTEAENATSSAKESLSYNNHNQLTGIAPSIGSAISYEYDAQGCASAASAGCTGAVDATLVREYHFMPGSKWSTNPLFQRDVQGCTNAASAGCTGAAEEALYYYVNDQLGTPQKLVTDAGVVVWSASVDAFGLAHIDGASTAINPLRFAGQYFDTETGLHQNYFRDYDSEVGRYLQSDPIGLEGGLNYYSFAYENPLAFSDPTGEFANLATGLAGGVMGAICSAVQQKGGCEIFKGFVSGAMTGLGVGFIPSVLTDAALSGMCAPPSCKGEEISKDFIGGRAGILLSIVVWMDIRLIRLMKEQITQELISHILRLHEKGYIVIIVIRQQNMRVELL